MAYSEDSDDILKRMLDRISSDVDKSEGSFIYDSLSAVSQELAQTGINLDEVLKRVFAITANEYGYSEELENRANEFGVQRKAGTKATGIIKFTGTNGTIINSGTLVQTESGLQFRTIASATISDGIAIVNIEADEVGTNYNVAANVIIKLPISIAGVTEITNEIPTTGGTDKETDQALLDRLLLKIRNPGTSGNANHYKLWALEVDGIGDAKILPLWNGNGTVKVILVDSEKQPATSTLITNVSNYIEENRPIGATITCIAPIAKNINIVVNISKSTVYTGSQVQNSIENNIKEYLKNIALKQDYVSYAQIGNSILNSEGVNDYNSLTVNGGTANVSLDVEEVAILGTVSITYV